MRAVLCEAFGPPQSLVLRALETPHPGRGEALVDVKAVALNFFDTLIIENKYQTRPPLPFSPGGEIAGVVRAVGEGVDLKEGAHVIGWLGHGGAREQVVAPASAFIAMPEGLEHAKAAGLCITYGTTLHALKDRAALKPGETLAVLGASGGVGLAAVEIGKAMGARVIACASSDDKLDFARAMGADEGVNYSTDDLKDTLKALTSGNGVDVIYDPVGDRLAEPALRAMAWAGRYLVIGFAGGAIPHIPLNLALLKGCAIVGVFWGAFVEREPALHQANMRQIMDWARTGTISGHVHGVFALEEAAVALDLLKSRAARGKVVLIP